MNSDQPAPSALASGPSSDVVRNKTPQKRLTKAAYEILKEFFNNVTPNPTASQKDELLKRVQAEAGCGWYTSYSLNNWFVSQRQKQKQRKSTGMSTGVGPPIAYTPAMIASLELFLREDPNPKSETIDNWANQLHLTVEAVHAYIAIKRSVAASSSSTSASRDLRSVAAIDTVGHSHLPTPSHSTSPEPLSAIGPSEPQTPLSSIYGKQTQASTLISQELLAAFHNALPQDLYEETVAAMLNAGIIDNHLLSGPGTLDFKNGHPASGTTHQGSVTDLVYPSSQPAQISQTSNACCHPLQEVLSRALSSISDDLVQSSPKSATEFNQLFSPLQTMMESFLQAIEQGEYRHIGVEPGDMNGLETSKQMETETP